MRASNKTWVLLALFLVTVDSGVGLAADKQADRERAALNRAQEALRRVEREKAALQQEIKVLKDDQAKAEVSAKEAVRAAEARAAAVQVALTQSRRAAEGLTQKQDALSKEKDQLTASMESLRTQFTAQLRALTEERDTALKTAAARDGDLARIRGVTQERTRVLGMCEEKNTKLYQIAEELIAGYEKRGLWDAVRTAEPLVQHKRVELENLMESYRDKARAERVGPAPRQ